MFIGQAYQIIKTYIIELRQLYCVFQRQLAFAGFIVAVYTLISTKHRCNFLLYKIVIFP